MSAFHDVIVLTIVIRISLLRYCKFHNRLPLIRAYRPFCRSYLDYTRPVERGAQMLEVRIWEV